MVDFFQDNIQIYFLSLGSIPIGLQPDFEVGVRRRVATSLIHR